MVKKRFLPIAVMLLIALLNSGSTGIETSSLLFKIGRSKDSNEIIYLANTVRNEQLNPGNPITPYWRKQTSGNIKESLTWIQQKYAYGLKYISKSDQNAVFQFVSYNKRNFELKKKRNGEYAVFTLSGKEEVEVHRIFIQIDGGTFWVPKISRVELHATAVNSRKPLIEIIIP
jgi:hypothetical protein